MLNSFKFKTLDGSSKVEFKKKINKNSFRKNQMLANIMSDTKKKHNYSVLKQMLLVF